MTGGNSSIVRGILKRVEVTSGVPQGKHLLPLLFNLVINTVTHNISSCRILLFADDVKLFAWITSTNDCNVLQPVVNSFVNFCTSVGLNLNFEKHKLFSFFRSLVLVDNDYFLNDSSLERAFKTKDLGFIYTLPLSLRSNINYTFCKGLRLLSFMRHHTANFTSVHFLKILYFVLVRSILDYDSIV